MSKVQPTRSKLTWDEIREIERKWKSYKGDMKKDVKLLIRHIRFMAHEAEKEHVIFHQKLNMQGIVK